MKELKVGSCLISVGSLFHYLKVDGKISYNKGLYSSGYFGDRLSFSSYLAWPAVVQLLVFIYSGIQ